MINKVINIDESNPMHKDLMKMMNYANDSNLIVVARSYKNRKDDAVEPVEIKNGIYFYVAYDLGASLVFPANVTAAQIAIAKSNMANKARLGTLMGASMTAAKLGNFMKYINEFNDWEKPMIVLTTDKLENGAGLLLCKDVLTFIKAKLGDCYILPSSIHEVLLMPTHMMSILDATEMVVGANRDAVTDDVYLAHRAFNIDEWL